MTLKAIDLGISEFEKLDLIEVQMLLVLNAEKLARIVAEVRGCPCGKCKPVTTHEVLEGFQEAFSLLKRSEKLMLALHLRLAHKAGGSEAVDQIMEAAGVFK